MNNNLYYLSIINFTVGCVYIITDMYENLMTKTSLYNV